MRELTNKELDAISGGSFTINVTANNWAKQVQVQKNVSWSTTGSQNQTLNQGSSVSISF